MSSVNPLRSDPTQLTTVRRQFRQAVTSSWEKLRTRLRAGVLTSEGFVTNASGDAGRVERFRAYLRKQMDSTLAGDALIDKYISLGFNKGLNRTQRSKQATGTTQAPTLPLPSRKVTADKVKVLVARTFSEMEDVNARTATRMVRVLVDGLVMGRTVEQVAKALDDETDIGMGRSLMVARTELTRAHAEGQLAAMEAQDVASVTARVEFTTSGAPCPKCASLEGKVYRVEDAHGIIPVHPFCMCSWSPVMEKVKVRRHGKRSN